VAPNSAHFMEICKLACTFFITRRILMVRGLSHFILTNKTRLHWLFSAPDPSVSEVLDCFRLNYAKWHLEEAAQLKLPSETLL